MKMWRDMSDITTLTFDRYFDEEKQEVLDTGLGRKA